MLKFMCSRTVRSRPIADGCVGNPEPASLASTLVMRLLADETGVAVAGMIVVIAVGDAATVDDEPAALDDGCAPALDEEEYPVPLEDDATALEELPIDTVPV